MVLIQIKSKLQNLHILPVGKFSISTYDGQHFVTNDVGVEKFEITSEEKELVEQQIVNAGITLILHP